MRWPLIRMRSFPLSGEKTDGAPAGFAALAKEDGPKPHRLKPVLPAPAIPCRASNIPAARGKANVARERFLKE
jgi:hypothetical protein